MEQVTIWISFDNEHGRKLAASVKKLGLTINLIEGYHIDELNVQKDEINIFIFDFIKIKPETILKDIQGEFKFEGFIKFLILPRKDINRISDYSFNIIHMEFISRPVYTREFLLLLEKSIISEKYREVLKLSSRDALSRIESFEGLIDINRKNVFESENEKEAFKKIIRYEKGLFREQYRLSNSIKEFSKVRQSSMFDMKKRIKAEESLDKLRHDELIHAKNVIYAQENLIDFSTMQLEEAKEILGASENVAELSRKEALNLHEELNSEKKLNKKMKKDIKKLQDAINKLKNKS